MKGKLPVLLSAAFGGISPNLLRLAISLMNENAELPEPTYLIGLLIFAVMGAVVALIWEETNYKKAFYLGIGLPAFIQMSAGEISNSQMAARWMDVNQSYLHAEATPQPFSWQIETVDYQEEQRRIELNFAEYTPRFFVRYTAPDSSVEEALFLKPGQRRLRLDVPDFARSFQIRILRSTSNPVTLPEQFPETPRYRVKIERTLWSGFRQAIGLPAEYQIRVEPVPPPEG